MVFGLRSGTWASWTARASAVHAVRGQASSQTPAQHPRKRGSGSHPQPHPSRRCGRGHVASLPRPKVSAATKWGSRHKPGLLPRVAVRFGGVCGAKLLRRLRDEQEGCHWAGAPRRPTARSRAAGSPSSSSSPAGARPGLRGSRAQHGAAGRQEQRPAVEAVCWAG